MTSKEINALDTILHQIGDFGKYQMMIFALICVGVVLHSGVHVAFVFTAMDVDYRCRIPECDVINSQFEPPWLQNAVPFKEKTPSKCLRYILNNATNFQNCSTETSFVVETKRCNSFIYRTNEKSILQEYDLQCEDNLWKLTLVGTINNIGQFVGLFIAGVISDKYGRRVVFIMGLILCGICGLIRTVAPTYTWFLFLEFLDAAFGAGSYACGFIMGVELVSPSKRVLTGSLISACYTLGEILAAGSAWIFQAWRPVIYCLYIPPMFLLFYFWVIPESVRWYLSKGRLKEAKQVLRKAAKVNGKPLNETSLDKLKVEDFQDTSTTLLEVLKSRCLCLRLINCIFCWITCAFLFYGLTLNSVTLAGNGYLDFILTALVEIPAYIVCIYLVDLIGRVWSQGGSFFITGISCIIYFFIPPEYHNVGLAFWMLGKFGCTVAFTVVYMLTSELFPTPLRHSIMGACSTFGRIGSMVAPQTPLLALVWAPLPILSFVTLSTIAGVLTFLFPETLNITLPDTIEDAVEIGKIQNPKK